jgi:hypothetical protein
MKIFSNILHLQSLYHNKIEASSSSNPLQIIFDVLI